MASHWLAALSCDAKQLLPRPGCNDKGHGHVRRRDDGNIRGVASSGAWLWAPPNVEIKLTPLFLTV